jgi:hypothetical protein
MCTVVNTAFGDYKKEVVIEKYYYYSIILKTIPTFAEQNSLINL